MWYEVRDNARKMFFALSLAFFLAAGGLLTQGDSLLGSTLLLAGTAAFYPAAKIELDLRHERRLRIK